MINGRLGSTSRWFGCALVAVLGLSLAQCAHAQQVGDFPDRSAASAACSAAENAWIGRGLYGSGAVDPCVISSCSESVESFELILGRSTTLTPECSRTSDVRNYFISESIPYSFNPGGFQSSRFLFSYIEGDDPDPVDCSLETEFDSTTMRAPTPNGSGGPVCYQDCQYDVGIWYHGTYPSGYVEWTWWPTGLSCQSGDDDPVTGPLDPDEPLDLDPEEGGVDPALDPGDGSGDSSGGGTCSQSPSCTGDSIQCNILFQTWATRCAAEDQGIGDGNAQDIVDGLDNIGDGVDGLGDGIDRIGDGVDGLGSGLDRIGDGIDDLGSGLDGLGNQLSNRSDAIFGQGEDVSGSIPGLGALNTGNRVFDENSLDQSGLGLPRSCPAILTDSISFSFFGNSYSLSFDMFCDLLELVGQILVVLSAFVGVRILLRSVS